MRTVVRHWPLAEVGKARQDRRNRLSHEMQSAACKSGGTGVQPVWASATGEWFVNGVFIGAGPWFHGPSDFHGHVDNHFHPGVFNESVSGDLSNSGLTPTLFTRFPGPSFSRRPCVIRESEGAACLDCSQPHSNPFCKSLGNLGLRANWVRSVESLMRQFHPQKAI